MHKVGDEVCLNSGGLVMTVVRIGDFSEQGYPSGVLCVWFVNDKKEQDIFAPETLRRFDRGETAGFVEINDF